MNIADETIEAVLNQLQFNQDGLIPAIAQDATTFEILMMDCPSASQN